MILSRWSSIQTWRVLVLCTVRVGRDLNSWQVIQNSWDLTLRVCSDGENFLIRFLLVSSWSVWEEIILMMWDLTIRSCVYLGTSRWYQRFRRISRVYIVIGWSFETLAFPHNTSSLADVRWIPIVKWLSLIAKVDISMCLNIPPVPSCFKSLIQGLETSRIVRTLTSWRLLLIL
jgi:hypothetical protein